jgi:transcription elongation GreA/GreB family factor
LVSAPGRTGLAERELSDDLPDRPILSHHNFVTEAGLAAIDAALARFEAVHAAATAKGKMEAGTAALREVRYWRARRATAEVVRPPVDTNQAVFGMTVTLRRDDGREQTFRIVGEDEANPSRSTVSYVSPFARAVLNHRPGETVEIAGQHAVIVDVR